MLTKNIMCEKLKDKGGTAMTADNPYRSLFKTPRQREVSRRNAEIASRFRREHKKGSAKITEPAITILIASSIIQTLLSVSELHRIGRRSGSRTVTAGRELHPTPKILYSNDIIISPLRIVKLYFGHLI